MIVSLDHDLINNNTFGLHAHCSRFVQWQSADEVIMWFAKPDNDVQPDSNSYNFNNDIFK